MEGQEQRHGGGKAREASNLAWSSRHTQAGRDENIKTS